MSNYNEIVNKFQFKLWLMISMLSIIALMPSTSVGRGSTPPPTAPTSISVPSSSTSGSYTISWYGGSNATSFRLHESKNGGSYTHIYGGSARSYSRSGRGSGTYRYKAYNCNAAGCSSAKTSGTITVVRTPSKPGTPGFSPSSISCSTNSTTVSWGAASGGNRYYLYQSINGGSWSTVMSNSTSRSKSRSLAQGSSYRYRVRARYYLNGHYSGYSSYSNTSSTISRPYCAPSTPSSITLSTTVSTNGSYSINWPAASGTVHWYEYRESTNGGSSYGGWVSNSTSRSKSWSGKGNGLYRYQIRACNSDICGSYATSSVITVVRTPSAPGAISFTPATLPCDSSFTVSWGSASGGNRYNLERNTDSNGWVVVASNSTSLSNMQNVEAGHDYQYRVRARYYLNGHYSNFSGYSSIGAVRKPDCVPTTSLIAMGVALGSDGKYHIGYDGVYTIQWSTTGVVSNYTLQEKEPGADWVTITPGSGTTMDFTKPGNYTTDPIDYHYRIQACNVDICSNWQEIIVAVLNYPRPGAPGTIQVIEGPNSTGYYKLEWGPSSGPELTHYNLVRDSGAPIEISNGTSYEFFDGVSGQTYAHQVEACNTPEACSGYTQPFNVYIPYPVPGVINEITGPSRIRGGNYSVAWEQATGPVAYYILEENNASTIINLNTGLEQIYEFSNQSTGDYSYRVKACNPDDVCAEFSNEIIVRVRNIKAPDLSNVTNPPESHPGEVFNGIVPGKESMNRSGAATYNIPLSLPPGTAGMMPNLSLNYNSQTGSTGWLGLGWSLAGASSHITRCNQTLEQDGRVHGVDLSGDDRFCINGKRLEVVSGNYAAVGSEYRTEVNQFSKITSHGGETGDPQYFKVHTANGNILSFGATANSRIEIQNNTRAIVWLLNKVEDRLGNYYTVQYIENSGNGAYRPDKIEYTANDNQSLSAYNTIQFEYESRYDTNVRYFAGSKRTTLMRLSNIKTYAIGVLVKDYQLSYEEVGPRRRSQLKNITACGRDNYGAEVCSEATHFTWTPVEQGWTLAGYEPPDDLYEEFKPGVLGSVTLFDFNGDGLIEMAQKQGLINSAYINNGQGWSNNSAYKLPDEVPAGDDGRDKGVRFVDFNADGLIDIIRSFKVGETSTPVIDAWRNTGTGWAVESSNGFIPPDYITNYFRGSGSHVGVRLIDVNGDKLQDFVMSRSQNVSQTWLNNGETWVASQDYVMPVAFYAGLSSGVKHEIKMEDLNGDGLPDLAFGRLQYNDITYSFPERVWINNGTDGWEEETSSTSTNYRGVITADTLNVRFVDLNGDGLLDLLHYHDDNDAATADIATAHLNTGNGWVSAPMYEPPVFLTIDDEEPYAVELKDVNGDGLPDFLDGRPESRNVWLNTGKGWQLSPAFSLPSQTINSGLRGQFEDVNGDGIVDMLRNTSKTVPQYTKAVWENNAKKVLLEKITDGLGYEIEYVYKPLTNDSIYTKGDISAYPECALQDSRYVVTKIKSSNGIGGQRILSYEYKGLKIQHKLNRSLGYAQIIETDVTANKEKITDYDQVFPKIGLIRGVEIKSISNNKTLKRVVKDYRVQPQSGNETLYHYLYQRTETIYEPGTGNQLSQSITTNMSPDTYGNIQSSTQELSDSINNTNHKTVIARHYKNDAQNWQLRMLETESIKKYLDNINESEKDRLTEFTYYANGRLKTRHQEPLQGAPYEMITTYGYDGFGNPETETVSGPSITTRQTIDIQYDLHGQYPQTIKNALQHTQVLKYDKRFGTLISHIDANGLVATWEVDAFGRYSKSIRPDGTIQEMVYYTTSDIGQAIFYSSVSETGKAALRTYYDKLGRQLRLRSRGFDGRYVYHDVEYDVRGNRNTTDPYFENDVPLWNISGFDDYNRLRSITAADSTKNKTINYDKYTIVVTDVAGNVTSTDKNTLGWTIQTTDANGTKTNYDYDAWSQPETVSNAVGTPDATVVSTKFDRLGRKIELIDPNAGRITYAYNNALSEQTTEETPEMRSVGQSRVLSTDILGRMKQRSEPEGVTTWEWDNTASGNLGIGHLYQENQSGFTRGYQYDVSDNGRLSRVVTQIGNETFIVGHSYNGNGQLSHLTYPASPGYPTGLSVKYQYTALGHLERISDTSDADKVYYQVLDRDAKGRLVDHWSGDGSTTVRFYTPGTGRLDTLYSVDVMDNTLENQKYHYDILGRLEQREDNRLGLSESFSHDTLHRVTSATVGAQVTNYRYDALGNLIDKSDFGILKYGSQCASQGDSVLRPHAVCERRAPDDSLLDTYLYDNNGNLIADGNRNLDWTSYNKASQVSQNSILRSFEYGPDRTRYQQIHTEAATTTTTLYISDLYERVTINNDSYHRHYIMANGKAVAIHVTTNITDATHYLHKDHLGSISTITDDYGDVVERNSYDVWGKRRNAENWLNDLSNVSEVRGYTGHEHMDDLSLINMNGRIYDFNLGRMMNPDPLVSSPYFSQSWNRYSYVMNNPLGLIDPSGYSPEDPIDTNITVTTDNDDRHSNDNDDGIDEIVYADNPWGDRDEQNYQAILSTIRASLRHMENLYYANQNTTVAQRMIDCGGSSCSETTVTLHPSDSLGQQGMTALGAINKYGMIVGGEWGNAESWMVSYKIPAHILNNPNYQWKWYNGNLVTSIYLNEDIASMLDEALNTLADGGNLADLKEFGGAFNIRLVRGKSSYTYSSHSYGLGLDINHSTNKLGSKGNQSSALIDAFTGAGFTYGGNWSRSDPMHFSAGY